MQVIRSYGVLLLITSYYNYICNIFCFRSIGHDHKNRTLANISEEEKFLSDNNDHEIQKMCDTRHHEEHDQFWIAKNITDLMDHLLQGYDRRIRPFFESKRAISILKFSFNRYCYTLQLFYAL